MKRLLRNDTGELEDDGDERLEMARELTYTGHDLQTCVSALERFRDNVDRASMWLLATTPSIMQHEADDGDHSGGGGWDGDPEAAAMRREGYAAL